MSFVRRLVIVLAVLGGGICVLVGAGLVWWHTGLGIKRFKDYSLDLSLDSRNLVSLDEFSAGAARGNITPEVPDRWADVNANGAFDEGTDRWTDGNGNHRFDKVWMAGFGYNRPAAGVHDSLWARAVVFGHPGCRVAICSLDLIGLFYGDVIDIRTRVEKALPDLPDRVDHVIVASTNVRAGPDVLGTWGPSETESGVDPAYLDHVREVAARTIVGAAQAAEPAEVQFAAARTGTDGFMQDRRAPIVMDDHIAVARFLRRGTDQTIAAVVNWGNDPEALDGKNLLITSDFPNYVREGVENGLPARRDGSPPQPGLGGVCVYLTGAVGGFVTPLDVNVPERFGPDTTYRRASFEKARALGLAVAEKVLEALRADPGDPGRPMRAPSITLRAKKILVPMENALFRAAAKLGVIERGLVGGKIRTEVDIMRLGPSCWTFVPGEICPEIVGGGVERPTGADFDAVPVEVPPIRSLMAADGDSHTLFVVGIANDEIGAIIPRSEWDAEAPFAYGRTERPYGEVNSVGPAAGPVLYATVQGFWAEVMGEAARASATE